MRSDREIYGLDGQAQACSGPARGGRLVEALVRHLHHEAKQIAGAGFRGIRGDQPAVDAARKKQPEWHIAPQPQAHRLAELRLELPKRVRPRAREAGWLGRRPIGSDHWRTAGRERESCRGGQGEHTIVHRLRVGNESEAKVVR